MRISIVLGPFLPVPPVLGGAVEKVFHQLAGLFARAGHEVTVVSRSYPGFPAREERDGVHHLRIKSRDRTSSLGLNLLLDAAYGLRVAACLPSSDVTVTNSFSLPVLLRKRRAGNIYVHVARFPKGQMFLYGRARRLQAISRAVGDEIARQAPWLSDRVNVIGYPVRDGNFVPSDAGGAKDRTILYVGRIAREKGVHLLLRAVALLRRRSAAAADWRLRIVGPHAVKEGGDGDGYLAGLQAIAAAFPGACEFAGPVFDEEALAAAYRSAAVFVYPSVADKGEALGLAPLEAMAAGCATVVSGLRCFEDFIEDEVNGLVFDHRAPDAEAQLADRLVRLVADAALRDRLARNAVRTAEAYRAPAIARRMLEDFASLMR